MSSHSTLTQRALIRLSPTAETEDVRSFLQGLVTQDMRRVLPANPQYGALLSAQGKTMFDFLLWDDGTDILIDCAREVAGDLARRLTLYRLRRNISIMREENLCAHWSTDPVEGASPDPRLDALGWRWLAPASGEAGTDETWQAHRLALGVAEGMAELGDILWLETNAVELNGVSFDKGCYVGQENTARMNWRQKVNRRIVVLPLTQADPKRQKVAYEDLGLSVEHRRIEDIPADLMPDWLRTSLG
jgi:folate-binding protein YgfZ